MSSDYQEFINKKLAFMPSVGIDSKIRVKGLFPHQEDLANWALRRGRAAIFADTGLGKSRILCAWADAVHHYTGKDILILAPLAVAPQTVQEGLQCGVKIKHVHCADDVEQGISITNYARLHLFDCSRFVGIVLDESSCIKHNNSKTLSHLLLSFAQTPYKLCCTATPSPNDFTELGTHAEFLGVRSHSEMLAEFFINDMKLANKWRLKGHAKVEFWKWVSSWGAMLRSPSDLGYDGSMYELPPLNIVQHVIETKPKDGNIFAIEAQTLTDRRGARRESIDQRVLECAEIVNNSSDIWLIWCELNAEGELLRKSIPGSIEVCGADSEEFKEKAMMDFAAGKIRVLISKSKIAGWGMNWQVCNNMAFVGVTDSFEAYYQSVRRCYRFGQKEQVNVHLFSCDTEGAVKDNLLRKEKRAKEMACELQSLVIDSVRSELLGFKKESNDYIPSVKIQLPVFL
ncbi:MAG: DEAD/DEAH box helicase [Candidatus Babeliaceae bacterium]|jgi:hypothetical protein